MSTHPLRSVVQIFCFILATSGCFAGTTYSNADFGFTVTLPDGFVSNDKALDVLRSMKWDDTNSTQKATKEYLEKIIAAFRQSETGTQILFENSFGKQIGNEPLSVSELPAGASVEHVAWGQYKVDCARLLTKDLTTGADHVALVIQMPLRPRAIQIRIDGTPAQEPGMIQARDELLATLQGPTNWDSEETAHSGPTEQQKADATAKLILYAGLSIAGFWWTFRTLFPKKPKRDNGIAP
jgi:hypothetical protein